MPVESFSVHADPDELEAQRLAAAVHGSEATSGSARRADKPAPATSGRGKVTARGQGGPQQRRYAFRRS
ncbi:hypothetical protein [Phytohabitans rumicis]|uniref:Uncharacterized protein n=1 Tax=Phytohabitans rumicis TaxID=1076125 RepID=A0A6V8L1A1_9ACTN|nr:hypothetical protein [Phytohabitans rumicis]GFJ88581.1 hypothetical protein Prum_022230 [Phytohabitans rumicis]